MSKIALLIGRGPMNRGIEHLGDDEQRQIRGGMVTEMEAIAKFLSAQVEPSELRFKYDGGNIDVVGMLASRRFAEAGANIIGCSRFKSPEDAQSHKCGKVLLSSNIRDQRARTLTDMPSFQELSGLSITGEVPAFGHDIGAKMTLSTPSFSMDAAEQEKEVNASADIVWGQIPEYMAMQFGVVRTEMFIGDADTLLVLPWVPLSMEELTIIMRAAYLDSLQRIIFISSQLPADHMRKPASAAVAALREFGCPKEIIAFYYDHEDGQVVQN